MKILKLLMSFFLFAFILNSQVNAQFMRKLGNTVTKRLEDKIINDAANTSEKALDKAEKEAGKSVKSKKNADSKAKDTSEEDLDYESIQNLLNNSASVEKLDDDYTVKVTGSGSDLFIAYQVQASSEQAAGFVMNIDIEMYVKPDKGSLTKTQMNIPMMGEMKMSTISSVDDPQSVIMVNEAQKTYAVIQEDDEDKKAMKDYTVTVVGKEKVLGLNCTHLQISSKKDKNVIDLWTTQDISDYGKLIDLYARNDQMGGNEMWQTLRAKDADGLLVKLSMNAQGAQSLMQIKKIERTTVSSDLLQVPSGYKEVKNVAFGNPFMK